MKIKLCFFNNHWNVYLYTEGGHNSWADYTTTTITDSRGEYRLREHKCEEAPIFSYGFMANDPKQRPGHGGEWSSNCSQINEVFGTDIYEVTIDQCSVAVPMQWLKELLGDRVIWEDDDIWVEWITSVKGEENEYMKWVGLEDNLVNS